MRVIHIGFNRILFSDATNDYSNNMSEQVDIVEVKIESDEIFSNCKNTNMFDNHLSNDNITLESKNHTLISV